MGGSDRPTRSRGRAARRRASVAVAAVALVVLASGCIVNGTWTATSPAVIPVQGPDTELVDVSCVSEDWCMAVGYAGFAPLLEVWDGTRWSVQMAPPTSPNEYGRIESIDCGTPTSCLAEVDRYDNGPTGGTYLVAWDGERWHEVPPGSDIDGPFVEPAPYSCAPDGSCVAVIQQHEVTVEWDGSQFSSTPYSTSRPPFFNEVNALDCLSASSCVAALSNGLGTWNGSAWSYGTGSGSPTYPDLWFNGPSELACTSTSDCVALGDGYVGDIVAGHWNGTAWTEPDLPDGLTSVIDLSCASPGSCLALARKPGTLVVLAWAGSTWYEASAAPVQLEGVSCLPQWCMVDGEPDGTSSLNPPQPFTYTWTNP